VACSANKKNRSNGLRRATATITARRGGGSIARQPRDRKSRRRCPRASGPPGSHDRCLGRQLRGERVRVFWLLRPEKGGTGEKRGGRDRQKPEESFDEQLRNLGVFQLRTGPSQTVSKTQPAGNERAGTAETIRAIFLSNHPCVYDTRRIPGILVFSSHHQNARQWTAPRTARAHRHGRGNFSWGPVTTE